ncbi:MAG: autotransporter-associated beta strand repeat-containing protein, partial [Thermoguttaceae bacterium]
PNVQPQNFVVGKTVYDVNFAGSMDGLLIANTAISQTQVTSLYNNGVVAPVNFLPVTTVLSTADGATVDFSGGSQQVAGLSGSGGTITTSGGPSLLTVASAGNTMYGGYLNDGNGQLSLTVAGSAILNLGNANTLSGLTTLSSGTLQLGHPLALQNSTLVANGGALDLNGQDATLGALAGTGNLSLNSGTLNVGNNSSNTTYSGNLGGSAPLVIIGSGTLALSNPNNSYSGNVTLNSGGLYVLGGLKSAPVNVTGGTLGGTGSVGPVVVSSGGIDAGLMSSGVLTASSIAFPGSATIHVSDSQTAAPLVITGALSASGGAGSVVINMDPGNAAVGAYDLISFGSLTGASGSAAFTMGTTPTLSIRESASLERVGNMLVWDVIGGTPYWTGANGTAFVGQNNWVLHPGNTTTDFMSGDVVTFDDSAVGYTVNVSTANVSPASLTFTATHTYTLGGSFGITGPAYLVKQNTGVLQINTNNSYMGGTAMNGGVLQLGNDNALGTGPLTLSAGTLSSVGGAPRSLANNTTLAGNVTLGDPVNNGSLEFSGSVSLNNATPTLTLASPVTIDGTISNGGLAVNGANSLTLSNSASDFAGNMTINGATVNVTGGLVGPNGTTSALGNPQVAGRTISVNSGATLAFAQQDVFGDPTSTPLVQINVNGGTLTTDGHLVTLGPISLSNGSVYAGNSSGVGNAFSLNGQVNASSGVSTLSSAGAAYNLSNVGSLITTFDVASGGTLQVSAPLADSALANSAGLTLQGQGTMLLSANNTYTGPTTVNGGSLILTGAISSGAGSQVTVAAASGQSASLTINGGMLNANKTGAPSLLVGTISGGTSSVNLISGSLTTVSEAWFGTAPNAVGILYVSGGSATFGSWLAIGRNGNAGYLNVSGGLVDVTTNNLTIAAFGGDQGQANVSGGTVETTNSIFAGESGSGTLTVSNTGTVVSGAELFVGHANAGAGVVNLDGGTITAPSVGTGGTGTSTFNFNGGSLISSAASTSFLGGLTAAYVRNGGAIFNTNGFNDTVSQSLLHSTLSGDNAIDGGLTKNGLGTLLLGSSDTYTGNTTVNGGTLDASSPASLSGYGASGEVAVAGGAVLAVQTSGGATGWSSAQIDTLRGSVNWAAGSGLGFDTSNGNFTYASNIAQPQLLVKLGANSLTLSGVNTYRGGTSVNEGSLTFANTASLPSSGTVTVAAGATLGLGVGPAPNYFQSTDLDKLFTGTKANVTLSPNALVGIDTAAGNFTYSSSIPATTLGLSKLGANTLTLTGSLMYTGPTLVSGGT